MVAGIESIEYALPERRLTNEDLSREYPDWSVEKIRAKTGIVSRRIAGDGECASDLAAAAAEMIFQKGSLRREDVDFILLCTQSPDYFLPTTACILQDRLHVPTSAGALDFNLGCSGFVYGLGLAKGLVETGQARHVLLLTAETYSKYINDRDRSVRTIFGDAAAATHVMAYEGDRAKIGNPVYGTDGSGAGNLIVPLGGARGRASGPEAAKEESAAERGPADLYMNGAEVFGFTLERVPDSIAGALARSGQTMDDIDLFVFHQANTFMLEHLRSKASIPEEKFFVSMDDIGNTVSSTIPIAMRRAIDAGRLKRGMRVMISGFGVGYSWATCIIEF